MKKALTGLLLFSQGIDAVTIDKSNYTQHLCDSGLFSGTIVSPASEHTEADEYIEAMQQDMIKNHHQVYCAHKANYNQALVDFVRHPGSRGTLYPCLENQKDMMQPKDCADKYGIMYAQACETLKADRGTMPNAWNSVTPKLVGCNNMRRR